MRTTPLFAFFLCSYQAIERNAFYKRLLEVQAGALWTATELVELKENIVQIERLFADAKAKQASHAAGFLIQRQGHEAKEKQLNTNIAKLRSSLQVSPPLVRLFLFKSSD